MTGRTLFTAAAAREGKPAAISWRAASLDIGACERVEFVTKAPADCPQWFSAWPQELRTDFELAIRRHVEQHQMIVCAVTFAVTGRAGAGARDERTCVALVHFHRDPSASAVRDGSPEDRPTADAPLQSQSAAGQAAPDAGAAASSSCGCA